MMERRRAVGGLLAGLVAALALWGARRGVPGARRLAARVAGRPAPAPTYGFKEVNLS